MTATVWEYILIFFIYAFMGWTTEVIFAALRSHTLVNRGFLNGPICPVYGFGMVAMLVLLGPWARSMGAVFLVGVIVPSLVELIAGALLYKLFHARWWDYSEKPFNIGGFICLQFSLAWGAAAIVMVMVVHPPIARLVAAIPETALRITDLVLLAVFAADVGVSAAEAIGLERGLRQMEELRAALRRGSDLLTELVGGQALTADELWDEGKLQLALARMEGRENAAEALAQFKARRSEIMTRYRELTARLDRQRFFGAGRLLRAFPTLKSPEHSETLERLRRHLHGFGRGGWGRR